MIKWDDEYQEECDYLSVGETTSVDHIDCPAGEDTRQRLYLTKVDDTKVICYCHNCQNGGYFRVGPSFRGAHSALSMLEMRDKEFEVPHVTYDDTSSWPVKAARIVFGAGLSTPKMYGIGYVEEADAIYYPIWDTVHVDPHLGGADLVDLKGYQLRPVTKKGSKYITVMKDSEVDMSTVITVKGFETLEAPLIVVEDLLSGIKVSRALKTTKMDGAVLVNYGTKVNLEAIQRGINSIGATHLLVWFDNDNPHVIKQAETIARTGPLISKGLRSTVIDVDVSGKKDPKAFNIATLILEINGGCR